ncbi:MAG: glucuronyl hydrolase [Mongoliibacter sp.]|uniref:glycoside hydrolase family 88 protein n=1 Tax=Mongoliibacter sp. TaxID=2022438 RepID=UPI0012F388F6|nr:glycoside hydrolase family 88 protein [Mongoliibacter sp.]TVP52550.1 MAG: glucuronyl hydrolase [Mongoliibacter sp.]
MFRKVYFSSKTLLYWIPVIFVVSLSCKSEEVKLDEIAFAGKQLTTAFQEIEQVRHNFPELVSPRSLRSDTLFMVKARDWTSGFFPGNLWWMYEATGEDFWKAKAMEFTAPLEVMKDFKGTHDLGFIFYCSFGKGYQLTGNEHYKAVMLEAADALISRYNEKVKAIRSWDHNTDKWQFPVIIDNMMNLEFLFWATKVTGDSTYYNIADTHAETTLANHFRDDFSSYHVIDYDTLTGEVKKKNTHQGYSHESSWSRGQAWGLYGFVMCYRETGKEKYLEMAEKIANLMLEHPNMPDDLIPYWDYDAPDIPNAPRDASAAAIMASAMFELSSYLSGDDLSYSQVADKVLDNLTSKYRSRLGENKGFILDHSTGHLPGKHEVDVPLVYADYYYLEALQRRKELKFTSELKFY